MAGGIGTVGWNGHLKIANDLGVLTEVAGVQSVKPPTNKRSTHDVTHLKSPGMRPQSISGMFEESDVSAKILYVAQSATALALVEAMKSGESRDVEVGIPVNGVVVEKWTFPAQISFEVDELEANKPQTATITLTVTDEVTVAPVGA